MTTEDFKRKLTAILSADVVGYSRLMGDDEESTVRTLNKYKEILFDLVNSNNGRVIDSPGDNVLAEFASVVDAVRGAVQIQVDLKKSNKLLPENKKMEFRIGINTGDVIQDGDLIYGDGVNIAARIESLADPGGICLSRSAYDQVKRKIDIKYDYLGEHGVKNIDEPVRVYKVTMDSIPDDILQKEISKRLTLGKTKTSTFSEKHSIAVLPFADLSPEKDQEYFVDGLTEEILNSLAQIKDLTVIAKTSSFSFKGKDKTIREIANVLDVDHILEGSMRKAGDTIRITAQLIKAVDGSHLWSKTYDRKLKIEEIFAVQEDIATSVADELKLTLGIGKSLKQLGGTDNLEAYELYLVAKGLFSQGPFYRTRALETIDTAIAMDSKYALAWAFKGIIHCTLAVITFADQVSSELDAGLNAALRAIELEDNLGQAYISLGLAHSFSCEFIEAEWAYQKGLGLTTEPIDYIEYGLLLHYLFVGNLKKVHEVVEKWRRNDPLDPMVRVGNMVFSGIFIGMERAEEEYKLGKTIFGDQWILGDLLIFILRLGSKDALSIHDVPESLKTTDPILVKSIESPEEGLAELLRIYSSDDNFPIGVISVMACMAASLGNPELALNFIERTAKSQSTSSVFLHIWLPVMRKVRQLPRFKEFMKEIGLVDYWKEYGWPDLCQPVGDDDFECD